MQRTAWIIWGSMLASLAIYAAFPAVWSRASGSPAGPAILPGLFGALALATGTATLVLREVLLSRAVRAGRIDPATPAGRQRVLQVSIVFWALSESIAVWGVVLYLLDGRAELLYAFVAGAALLLLLHAPRSGSPRAGGSSADLARPDVRIG